MRMPSDMQERLRTHLRTLNRALGLLQRPTPPPDMPIQVEQLLREAIDELQGFVTPSPWPEPTVEEPDLATIESWLEDGSCQATDGCWTDPDGRCPHGHPAWLLRLGLI